MKIDDFPMRLATFRFGIISDFVGGPRLGYGEAQRLFSQKTGRVYEIPGSTRTNVSKSTINSWISKYKKANHRIEGLMPKERSDRGSFRKLDATIRMATKELKTENPNLTVPAIITKLKHAKVLGADDQINKSSLYRYIKKEKLDELPTAAEASVDRRKFEAAHPNDIWQCDVMHGPQVKMAQGPQKKAYLIAIMDDHSRLVVAAQFFLSETVESLLEALRQAIERRGIPSKFYVDNGACYRAHHLEQTLAALGIALAHSRPYIPQGRGKIERWFRYVRQDFIPVYADKPLSLDELNERLEAWVDRYNDTPHSAIKCAPYDRFRNNLSCIRPAPQRLIDYFRQVEVRRVRKDRTVQLTNRYFEVPVGLIDKQVELRFHGDAPTEVEVFFESRSFGMAQLLDVHVNGRVGRDYGDGGDDSKPRKTKSEPVLKDDPVTTGRLFSGDSPEVLQ